MWFPTHFKTFTSLLSSPYQFRFFSSIFIMEKNPDAPTSPFTNLFIETIHFSTETLSFLSSLTSDPLFSIFTTLYALILLYFPRILLNLIFSPIIISTALLLSTLLRWGSNQPAQRDELLASTTEVLEWVSSEPETETEYEPQQPFCTESMVEWNRNVRAPLEVIYEEYEGEEEHRWNQKQQNRQIQDMGIDQLASLSLYYPESDSDSSSDGDFPAIEGWDSPENMCFRWDEEDDDKEGLIEIQLNGKRCCDFQVEEDNLIEIDLSLTGAPMSM